MDFLTHCEDVGVVQSISGALEFEKASVPRLGESVHEELNFIDNADIACTE